MVRLNPTTRSSDEKPSPIWRPAGVLGLASMILFSSSGCNLFGIAVTTTVRELRHENERLLTEFRAEKKRREEMENTLRTMEARLAESEKMVAQQHSPSTERFSQLNPLTAQPGVGGVLPYGSNSNGRLGTQPYASSPTPYRGDSGGLPNDYNSADADSGLQWQRRMSR